MKLVAFSIYLSYTTPKGDTMLNSYKKVYSQNADRLIKEDWRHMDKNQLVNKYIEVEEDEELAEAYLCAIICRYWGALNKYYSMSYKSVPDITIYHDWLVQAIMRAIKNRKWKDPENKLYNDPAGPDKVINRCLISERLIYYQGANTFKRKGNYKNESLDKLQDELGEDPSILSHIDERLDGGSISITNLVKDTFNNKDYVLSFMIDGIINADVFDKKDQEDVRESTFSKKKLLKHLRNIDENYCKIFSTNMNIPLKEVREAANELNSFPRNKMIIAIKLNLKKLRKMYSKIEE